MFSQPVTPSLSWTARCRRFLAAAIYPRLLRIEFELVAAHEAIEMARIDPLTGANTRIAYEGFVKGPEAQQFDCIAIDLDHFKDINDCWGHPTGDLALRYVGECIRIICEVYGLPVRQRFYRYGGDELVVFVEPDKLQAVARSILQLVVSPVRADEYQELPLIMISYGCGHDFKEADRDLYDVKNIDRCQV